MKILKLLPLVALVFVTSCSSIRVSSDYDDKTNFNNYKTYAFLKEGVDELEISDIDKKRILTALDTELSQKGFTKDNNPDFLINIFTKAQQRVNVNQNYYSPWGYGWGPYWGPNYNYVSTSVEGYLYIDVIDAKNKELIWQGVGTGYLTRDRSKKEAKIQEFVSKVLSQFPPKSK